MFLLACARPEPAPEPRAEVPDRVWVEFADEGDGYTAACRSDPPMVGEVRWLVDGEEREPTGLGCRTAVACELDGWLSEASRPDEQFDLVLRASAQGEALLCRVTCGVLADEDFELSWDGRPGPLLWPQARAEVNTCVAEGPITASLEVRPGPAEAITHVELLGPEGDFGFALAAGDTDGDGALDLVLGAPKAGSSTYAGQVLRIGGSALGVESVEVSEVLYEGGAVADYAGWSVAMADPDADGLDEVLVGAPGHSSVAHRGGMVLLLDEAITEWIGGETYGWAGVDVALSTEALAGAYGVDEERGAAYLLGDLSTPLIEGSVAAEYLGLAVDFAGDTDGDGLDEVVVGAPGQARVALVDDEVRWLTGDADSAFGWDVAGLGDFDGDGLDDVAVAAPAQDAGWVGELRIDLDARSVAAFGDQDEDGFAELLLGEPNAGTAWIVHSDGTWIPLESEVENAGWAVLGVPDLDGDGQAEVLVGALEATTATLWMSPHD